MLSLAADNLGVDSIVATAQKELVHTRDLLNESLVFEVRGVNAICEIGLDL